MDENAEIEEGVCVCIEDFQMTEDGFCVLCKDEENFNSKSGECECEGKLWENWSLNVVVAWSKVSHFS